eukprot:4097573-Prorocentrum_lima.AAC.1
MASGAVFESQLANGGATCAQVLTRPSQRLRHSCGASYVALGSSAPPQAPPAPPACPARPLPA